jgi:uncharacterized membrane-anchored protein
MTWNCWRLTARSLLVALLLALTPSLATAQQAPAPAPIDPAKELDAAADAALAAMRAGPTDVRLRDQAVLRLPAGYGYIPPAESQRLLRAMGNRPGSDLEGLVIDSARPFAGWFVVIRHVPSGYVKDDDAKDWNADDLLSSLREGTEEANKERRSRGFPELEVVGWVQRPAYEAKTHRLVWSAETREKASASAERGVNYNTYALGREGYFSLNLVTDLALIGSLKPRAAELLAALAYNEGKRYEDFNASTDRVAEFGLAALVAGAAAKKLGLFALIGVFLAKFWKIAAIAVVAFGAGAFKLFRRKA